MRIAPLQTLAVTLAAVATAACATMDPPATPAVDPQVWAGRTLVAQRCAGCHSTSQGAASVYRAAPPLWTLSADYTPDRLQRAAAEQAAHAFAMPRVLLTMGEAEDVIAYVRALERADADTRRTLAVPPCIASAC